MAKVLGKSLSKIEEILLKEGFTDWIGGTIGKGQIEHINYDECVIIMKKIPDNEWYMRVYATNKIHHKAYHEFDTQYGKSIKKHIRIEKINNQTPWELYES